MTEKLKPPVLDYATQARPPMVDRARWIFLILGIPSLVVPFVSFAYERSPLNAIVDGGADYQYFLLLALPFFIAIPLVALKARVQFWGNVTAAEHVIAYTVAICSLAGTCVMLCVLGEVLRNSPPPISPETILYVAFILTSLVPVGGAVLVAVMIRSVAGRRVASEAALLFAYVANAVLCLLAFSFLPLGLGWYLTCFVVAVFVADIVHLMIWVRKCRLV